LKRLRVLIPRMRVLVYVAKPKPCATPAALHLPLGLG
jgi:hypothetical protein